MSSGATPPPPPPSRSPPLVIGSLVPSEPTGGAGAGVAETKEDDGGDAEDGREDEEGGEHPLQAAFSAMIHTACHERCRQVMEAALVAGAEQYKRRTALGGRMTDVPDAVGTACIPVHSPYVMESPTHEIRIGRATTTELAIASAAARYRAPSGMVAAWCTQWCSRRGR
jgi:hypothetical protein